LSSRYRPPSVFTPFLRRFTDERARDVQDTIALYEEVRSAFLASCWNAPQALADTAHTIVVDIAKYVELPAHPVLREALDTCLLAILAQETALFTCPEIDWNSAVLSPKELLDLRRFLRAQQHFLANQDRVLDLLVQELGNLYGGIAQHLPQIEDEETSLTVPLLYLLADPKGDIDKIAGTLTKPSLVEAGLLTTIYRRIYENACYASGLVSDEEHKKPLVAPGDSDLPPLELAQTYLKGTPLLDLLLTPAPFALPQRARFEHHWIVAPPGAGKTQTIQYLVAEDLKRVARGEASIIVLDSQQDLIRTISELAVFAPGGALHGKLVLIDPTDLDYPVALNLFDVGLERLRSYSALDRETLLNGALELLDFVLTGLLGAEMTSRQSTLFRFTMQLLLHIPDATIHTFRELMQPGGYERYARYVGKLDDIAQDFFRTQYNSPQFTKTKEEVVARLFAILRNQTLARMFSFPRTKLDLFAEMNAGKVILINNAESLLKKSGVEILGRFFLAMIAMAAQERTTLPQDRRLPCFVYVDECHDLIRNDPNITIILEQARKQRVGIILAHQHLSQLAQRVLDSLQGATSIKFASAVSDANAHALARNMRTTPEFIEKQPTGSFATYIRGMPNAVSIQVPFLVMEKMARMTGSQREQVRRDMRVKYAERWGERKASAAPKADKPQDPSDTDPAEW
jgi:hypothetical protein